MKNLGSIITVIYAQYVEPLPEPNILPLLLVIAIIGILLLRGKPIKASKKKKPT